MRLPLTLSDTQAKTLYGIAAVVIAFLLAQPDLAFGPSTKVFLGAALAVLAYLDPAEHKGPAS